jgi:uncharacterized membrane protein
MFSVAMTLLATTLILPVQTPGESAATLLAIGAAVPSVALSFAISAAYWLGQQRWLAITRDLTSWETALHFTLLFLVVLLPISTAVSVRGGADHLVVLVYSTHLVLLGSVNLLLWIGVRREPLGRDRLVGAWLSFGVFATALAIASVWPDVARYVWYAAFVMPWLGRRLTRKKSPA